VNEILGNDIEEVKASDFNKLNLGDDEIPFTKKAKMIDTMSPKSRTTSKNTRSSFGLKKPVEPMSPITGSKFLVPE